MMRVALTIDVEHPDRSTNVGVTEAILEALGAAAVPATMFLQGRWVQAYPKTARAIADAGHLIGSHSHFHARMPMFSRAGLASDVRAATVAIRDVTGTDPRPWFRCPFGAVDRGTRVLDGLARLGYRNVGWNVDSRDWASRSSASIIERVVAGTHEHGDGAIVLMHGWPRLSATALPGLIAALRDVGAEFVTVDRLDSVPVRAAWDRAAGWPGTG